MRNILQYPITVDEKIATIEEMLELTAQSDAITGAVGDIAGSALIAILADVIRLAEYDKKFGKMDNPVETFRQSMTDSRNARD